MFKAYFVRWLKMKNRKTEIHLSKVSKADSVIKFQQFFQLADHVKHRIFALTSHTMLNCTWLSNLWSAHTWMGQGGRSELDWMGYTKSQCPILALWPQLCIEMSIQFQKNKRQSVMVVFDWIAASCSTVKLKDVTDVDIETDKRCRRERCLPWDYPTVLVANENACKIEKPQLSLIVGGKGEG